MTNDQYLHENRAWNWKWPGERNCWPGPASRPKGPQSPYKQARRRGKGRKKAK